MQDVGDVLKRRIITLCRLTYRRDRLLHRVNQLIKNFDAELRCLNHHKCKLDIEMKNADLRFRIVLLADLNDIFYLFIFIYYKVLYIKYRNIHKQ